MNARHTPGRLASNGKRAIYDAGGALFATLHDADFDRMQGDARRMVACWNACEGIDTEYLEGDESLPHYAGRLMAQCDELLAERDALQARTATDFVEHQRELSKALDQRDELQKQVAEIGQFGMVLREQRDELLAALKALLEDTQHADHPDCESGPCPVRDARAAIAKVEAGK